MSVSGSKQHMLSKQWKHEIEYAKPTPPPPKLIAPLDVQVLHFLRQRKTIKKLI